MLKSLTEKNFQTYLKSKIAANKILYIANPPNPLIDEYLKNILNAIQELTNEKIIDGKISFFNGIWSRLPKSVLIKDRVKAPIITGKDSRVEIIMDVFLSIPRNLEDIIVVADLLAPGISEKH